MYPEYTGDIFNVSFKYLAIVGLSKQTAIEGINIHRQVRTIFMSLQHTIYDTFSNSCVLNIYSLIGLLSRESDDSSVLIGVLSCESDYSSVNNFYSFYKFL